MTASPATAVEEVKFRGTFDGEIPMNKPLILNAMCQQCGLYGSQKCPRCIVEMQRQKLVLSAMSEQMAKTTQLRRSS
jgi:hypothetical protein